MEKYFFIYLESSPQEKFRRLPYFIYLNGTHFQKELCLLLLSIELNKYIIFYLSMLNEIYV